MLQINVPGFKSLTLHHLVLDFNGTLAVDGWLLPGVEEALAELSQHLAIRILTADTFGSAQSQLKNVKAALAILGPEDQSQAKREMVRTLGADHVVAIGNGRNDRGMLAEAGPGIAVIQGEGSAREACSAAHLVCPTILDALTLLRKPQRLVATLRS
ncbi:MAG: HAD hydrolase family protein [Candidatus Riflebacteria bacterium]|nr:HAD hydrolase family protein [Candidatus Riflebacteria bacterium]